MKICPDCQSSLTDIELRFNAAQEIKAPRCFRCWGNVYGKSVAEVRGYAESYLNAKPCKGRNNLYKEWIKENKSDE